MASGWRWMKWFVFVAAAVIGGGYSGIGGGVSYDGRSLIIDGQRKLLFSGSIHYPRSTPDMWPSLIKKAKNGGLDTIDTYVFWGLHEPQPGQYNFSGRRDVVSFIKAVQAQNLYVCLRIGPFIQAEWNYGGFPFWLHDVPGIVFRTDNEPFKFYMQNFTSKIVNMLKSEKLFASQGGPIILSQIENEYRNVERAFGENGPKYVKWAAKMAVGLDTGVPWVMCKQDDAPDPVINSCNGRKCGETFVGPNSPNKPALWTENWTHFYDAYGNATRIRKVEDIAYHAVLFIVKKNGSFINYYMYHGGTNFGRTASSFKLTSYYDQAPLDEYGLIRQPKWGHLRDLHASIKQISNTLLYGKQTNSSLDPSQQAYVYKGDDGECVAFLVNGHLLHSAKVQFLNRTYRLPRYSISVLPDCENVAFNTGKVSSQYGTRSRIAGVKLDSAELWEEWSEVVPVYDNTQTRSNMLLEQMDTTKDTTDFLWYTANYEHLEEDGERAINISSYGHVLHAFVNGQLVDSKHGSFEHTSFTLATKAPLQSGTNNISLLSVMVGLPDSGAYLEGRAAGLKNVRIEDDKDLTNYAWGYQVGLWGEKLQLYTQQGLTNVEWTKYQTNPNPLTWYKARFDAPAGTDPLALNLASMGKGEVWVNGQSIGRYWISYRLSNGSSSQTWYHIPRSFVKQKDNLLVLLEEETGNPLKISVDTVSISKVCGHVTNASPPTVSTWQSESQMMRKPRLELGCPQKRKISKILFASYGNPSGNCTTNYALGECHSINSTFIVEMACLGKRRCSIPLSSKKFGGDPCPGIPKDLLVEAKCHR